jgi:hypothetical protein
MQDRIGKSSIERIGLDDLVTPYSDGFVCHVLGDVTCTDVEILIADVAILHLAASADDGDRRSFDDSRSKFPRIARARLTICVGNERHSHLTFG